MLRRNFLKFLGTLPILGLTDSKASGTIEQSINKVLDEYVQVPYVGIEYSSGEQVIYHRLMKRSEYEDLFRKVRCTTTPNIV